MRRFWNSIIRLEGIKPSKNAPNIGQELSNPKHSLPTARK